MHAIFFDTAFESLLFHCHASAQWNKPYVFVRWFVVSLFAICFKAAVQNKTQMDGIHLSLD